PIFTVAVGLLVRTTVNDAVPPESVVIKPEVGVTVMPAKTRRSSRRSNRGQRRDEKGLRVDLRLGRIVRRGHARIGEKSLVMLCRDTEAPFKSCPHRRSG